MTGPLRVGIFSRASDLHAHVIARQLGERDDVVCDFVAVDKLHESPSMVWGNADRGESMALPTMGATRTTNVRDLDVIWWRRPPSTQSVSEVYDDPNHLELINNDCAAAVVGLTEVAFRGIWVSTPSSTRRAENKIVQLHTAQACGLRVPRTLITQDPVVLGDFIKGIGTPIVVKALRGPLHVGVPTSSFLPEHLSRTEAIRAAPAIYQEYVPGSMHLRVHCFGTHVLTASIESNELDWRGDLTVPFRPFGLPGDIRSKLQRVLRALGLRMGIFDLKVSPTGEYYWLELNPQGQFLFVEGLVQELELADAFARFLRKEATEGRRIKALGGPDYSGGQVPWPRSRALR